jgi:hypothetical protein
MNLDRKIRMLLEWNITYFTNLMNYFMQGSTDQAYFLARLSQIGLMQNRMIYDIISHLEFEPADNETQEFVQEQVEGPVEMEEITEGTVKDIKELTRIYELRDDRENWFYRLFRRQDQL